MILAAWKRPKGTLKGRHREEEKEKKKKKRFAWEIIGREGILEVKGLGWVSKDFYLCR